MGLRLTAPKDFNRLGKDKDGHPQKQGRHPDREVILDIGESASFVP